MRKNLPAASAMAAALLFASCSPQYYRPRPNNPPMLSEKGQIRLDGMATIASAGAAGLSLAASPVKHFGLQAGYSSSRTRSDYSSGSVSYGYDTRRLLFFGGLGYYTAFGNKGHFEVYGGAGSANYRDKASGTIQRLGFTNYYVQPAVGIKFNEKKDNFELAFSLRYDHLRRGTTIFNTAAPAPDLMGEERFLNYKSYNFLQPAVTFRAGIPAVKFMFEIYNSYALDLDYESIYGGSPYQSGVFRIAAGVSVGLNEVFK